MKTIIMGAGFIVVTIVLFLLIVGNRLKKFSKYYIEIKNKEKKEQENYLAELHEIDTDMKILTEQEGFGNLTHEGLCFHHLKRVKLCAKRTRRMIEYSGFLAKIWEQINHLRRNLLTFGKLYDIL